MTILLSTRRAGGLYTGQVPKPLLYVPTSCFVEHGVEVLDLAVVGDGVSRPEGKPPSSPASIENFPATRTNLLRRALGQQVDVDTTQNRNPVSISLEDRFHRLDDIFKAVKGVDLDDFNQVLHQRVDIAAGMKQEELAVFVARLGDPFLAGNDPFPEKIWRETMTLQKIK